MVKFNELSDQQLSKILERAKYFTTEKYVRYKKKKF